MREAWDEQAANWIAFVRARLDKGWDLTRPPFLALLPPAGRLTLDVGCGEGRLGRALTDAGHRVVGVDASFTLAHAAATHESPLHALVSDASHLAVCDAAADLVVAFMSLMDIDDLQGAVREAARVLRPGGLFCFAIVHPVAESGRFQKDGTFLMDRSYLGVWRYPDPVQRQGFEMTFHTEHRPISRYSKALLEAGFVIEEIREPIPDEDVLAARPEEARWRQVPNFLMVRARLSAHHD